MKKGLSVLLIVAALFGFYGGAVSLNDVLAAKDYWQEKGAQTTADMNKLEDGLNQLAENKDAYLDGLEQVADGEEALAEGEATLASGYADYAAAPGKLAAARAKLAAGWASYKAGLKTYNAGLKQYNEGKATLAALKKKLAALVEGFTTWKNGYDTLRANADENWPSGFEGLLKNGSLDADKLAFFVSTMKGSINDGVQASVRDGVAATMYKNYYEGAYAGAIKNGYSEEQAAAYADNYAKGQGFATTYEDCNATGKATVDGYISQNLGLSFEGADTIKSDLTTLVNINFGGKKDTFQAYLDKVNSLDSTPNLISGKKEMATQLTTLLDSVASDEDNLKAIGGKEVVEKAKYGLKADDATFRGTVESLIVAANNLVSKSEAKLAAAKKQLASGKATLDAGLKKLKSGEAQYAAGLASYKAAPAKLADGEKQVADGKAALAAGKEQLATYEDGEQQVRDGLATLMSTEPADGLVSILDRRDGDDDFELADGTLDTDDGLAAVEVGRGYQSDSGDLITAEVTQRAVGTAAGLAAGVLAVIAAVLSFIKKNKGAGVCAILAAVAGAFGAFYGSQAGWEYTQTAGGTSYNTPWIAAGILGAVALVHAIAHFTAKKSA